ncbi:MAG: hypothetical protein ACYSUQ_08835 [Planctomycetota bacterium]|jgi:hypothetical protein
MRCTLVRLLTAALIVCLATDFVLAGPFDFGFANPGLTALFLLPFQIAGCG